MKMVAGIKQRSWVPLTDFPVLGFSFICLGIFLRIYNFSKLPLLIDEYGTWWVIAPRDWGEVARRAFDIQGQSPFYYLLVKLSSDLFGIGTVSLRLPSLLFGVAAVVLAYPLAVRIFSDRHPALLALAAFAVNEKLIFSSQEARPYSLALLCTMLSFLFYTSLLQTEKLSNRVGYLLATAGAYYAHYLFGLVVVIQILHLFFIHGWSWLKSREWKVSLLLLVLICLPAAAQLSRLFERRESLNWVPSQKPLTPVILALEYLDPWVFFPVALVILAIVILGRPPVEKPQFHGLDLILLWFLSPLVLFTVISPLFGISLLHARYVLVGLPAAILVVAWLMAFERRTSWWKWIPLTVFLTMSFAWNLIPAVRATGTFSKRPFEGWNKAVEVLERNAQEDDLVLYRTGFVEAAQLSLLDRDPLMASFIAWPVTANLSPGRKFNMIMLPYHSYHESRRAAAYISAVVKEAAKSRRVWVIGRGAEITDMSQDLVRSALFQLRRRDFYGKVQLVLLEQNSQRVH